MRTLEASGKSIDEAIFNGLRELQISIDEVEIEIVQQEAKGILGLGSKPAIVRLIEREPEDISLPEYLLNPREERRSEPRQPRNDRPRRPRNDSRNSRPRKTYEEKPFEAEEFEAAEEKVLVDYSLEAAENNEAALFLKGLLDRMHIANRVYANVTEEEIKLQIESENMGIIIGHRGETLDAIQYLTSLHYNNLNKDKSYTRISIDTEGYRGKREETLKRLARRVASQVRSSGKPKMLEPMNPYERRILHATLQNNPYVITYSEGENMNRRVIVAPKGMEK